jgi:hypothetical protein
MLSGQWIHHLNPLPNKGEESWTAHTSKATRATSRT